VTDEFLHQGFGQCRPFSYSGSTVFPMFKPFQQNLNVQVIASTFGLTVDLTVKQHITHREGLDNEFYLCGSTFMNNYYSPLSSLSCPTGAV